MIGRYNFLGGPYDGTVQQIKLAGPNLPPPPWLHLLARTDDPDSVAVYERQPAPSLVSGALGWWYVYRPPIEAANASE